MRFNKVHRLGLVAMLLCVAGTGLIPISAQAAGPPSFTVLTSHLDNPRGIALGDEGQLIVGEAGHGGDVFRPGGAPIALGLTSKVTAVNARTGSQSVLASGLISLTDLDLHATIGVSGVTTRDGQIYGVVGEFPQALAGLPTTACNGLPADCAQVLAGAVAQLGQLIKVDEEGWRAVLGVGSIDYLRALSRTAQLQKEANPYGVLATNGGVYIADAASNTLDFVTNRGAYSELTWFPDPVPAQAFPVDAVPTCVAKIGNVLYIGDLAGELYSWKNGVMHRLAAGGLLKHITGCAAHDGALYLVNIFTTVAPSPAAVGTGNVIKFVPGQGASLFADGLNFPNMIAITESGKVYLTHNSTCPATGVPGCSGEVVLLKARAGGESPQD
jgi:hypothetical protein